MATRSQISTKNIWGKRAKWVDYSTMLKGERVGVTVFDHPKNPKYPTYWHARGYSLCAANPFGEHKFLDDSTRNGSITVPAGAALVFQYKVMIHPGGLDSIDAQKIATDFAGEDWK